MKRATGVWNRVIPESGEDYKRVRRKYSDSALKSKRATKLKREWDDQMMDAWLECCQASFRNNDYSALNVCHLFTDKSIPPYNVQILDQPLMFLFRHFLQKLVFLIPNDVSVLHHLKIHLTPDM